MGGETLQNQDDTKNEKWKPEPVDASESKKISPVEQKKADILSEYGKIAEGLKIKPVDIPNSMRIDGKTFTDIDNRAGEIPKNVSDNGDVGINTSEIGKYATNNSVISWVNERGETYITPQDNESISKLNAAGYKQEQGMFVPMSNGEKFGEKYNDEDRKHWDQLQKDNVEKQILRSKINQ